MKRFGSVLWVSVILATGTAGIALLAPAATAASGDRAGDQLDDQTMPGSDPAALLLLERAERAAYTVPYSGVRYLATWCPRGTTSAIVEISHVPGVGTTVLLRNTAADPAGRALANSTAARPITAPDASRPAATGLVARNFQVILTGKDEVAGRRAAVVEVRRPGTGTLAARMWLDSATALVLRLDVFDSTGATVRAGGFIAIKVERPTAVQTMLPPPVGPAELNQVRSDGWIVPSELANALRLYDLQTLPGAIVHASYSDGLSTVSVFAQHGRLDTGALSGYSKVHLGGAAVYVYDGTPRRVMWAANGRVYTILTDAPDEMIESVLATLPRDTADGGLVARLGRGLSRVGSWFNPFG
ncbi:MAG: sigma-E factor regulatory protein RseB domain-containing protein [Actinomycetes bacterium]